MPEPKFTMNKEDIMEAGIKGHAEVLVDETNIASRLGSGVVDVFATPCLIGLMEEASQTSVAPFLDEGMTTVGTKLNVSHDAATPVGMKVWADSELIEADGRRLVFQVKAYDESGLVGQGTHERFIVKLDRFMEKAGAKKK